MRKGVRRALLALLLVGSVMLLGSLVAQASSGGDPLFDTRLGPVQERPLSVDEGDPSSGGDLMDWSGIDWGPWLRGLWSTPWGWMVTGAAGLAFVFADRLGIFKLVGVLRDRFNQSWDRVRENRIGWWATEIPRRAILPVLGIVIWAVKQVAALPGAIAGLVGWLARGTWENIKTAYAFATADLAGKVEIAEAKWEKTKAAWGFVKGFWNETKERWSRGWNGLRRVYTDPAVTNEELLQWGADHASMAADAAVVVPIAGAAVNGVKGVSWFGELRSAVSVAQSARTGTLGGVVDDLGRFGDDVARLQKTPSGVATQLPKESAVVSRIDYSKGFIDDLENFLPGYKYVSRPLEDDLILIQFHRGDRALDAGRSAKWWTTSDQGLQVYQSEESIRQVLALPPAWGPRDAVSVARIPKGTHVTFYEGLTAPQVSDGVRYVGGGVQMRFKDFDPSWIVVDSKPVMEFDPSWVLKLD